MGLFPRKDKHIYGDYSDDIVLELRDGTHVKYSVGPGPAAGQPAKSGVIDEFIAAILEDRRPLVTGRDGHYTLAVIQKAMQSAGESRWLEIEY